MSHPLVGNIHHNRRAEGVYVGRKDGSQFHYGNPFTHKKGTLANIIVGSREEAIVAFRDWLEGKAYQEVEPKRRQWILDHLAELKGKRLLCFCAPQACHGDILAEMADKHESPQVQD